MFKFQLNDLESPYRQGFNAGKPAGSLQKVYGGVDEVAYRQPLMYLSSNKEYIRGYREGYTEGYSLTHRRFDK